MTVQDNGPPMPAPLGPASSTPNSEASGDPWSDDPEYRSPEGGGFDGGGDEPPAGATPPGRPPAKKPSGARAFVDWVVVVTVALLVAFVVRGFVLAHFVVDGQSMATTLDTGDRVFVNKLSYRLHEPDRGDVVVLHQLNGVTERDLIKRVIALPGEQIEMTSCVVRITLANSTTSQILDEPYLDEQDRRPGECGGDVQPQTVPENHVFVMGDNRGGSQDSRALGAISEDDLVGRAFIVFWPRDHWQWL